MVAAISVSIVSGWLKRSLLFQFQRVAQEVAAISVSVVSGWLKRSLLFQLV